MNSEMFRAARSFSFTRRSVVRFSILIVVVYFIVTSLAAVSTQRAADSLFSADAVSTLEGGEDEIAGLEDKLAVFDYRYRRLKVWLVPAHVVARVVGIIPPIRRQVRGAELLMERVELDHAGATAALALGRSTIALQDTVADNPNSIADTGNTSQIRESLYGVISNSKNVIAALEYAAAVGVRFDGIGLSGPIVSVNDRISNQELQLSELAEFSLLLSEVILADMDLLTQVDSTFDGLRMFIVGDRSITELTNQFDVLASRTSDVSKLSVRMASIAPPGITNTEYGGIVQDLRRLNVTVNELVQGIDTVLDIVSGSIETLSSTEGSLFGDGVAISETIEILIANEDELNSSAQQISESIVSLLEVGESGSISIGEFGDVLPDRTESLIELAELLKSMPKVLAEILGIDGETRRYLVLGQTSDELRAAGGFTSSAWLLTFRSGAMVDREYFDVALIADQDSLDEYPEANEELQLHMDAGRLFLRDVGWDPHFPNVGQLAADIYSIRQPVRVDGVISMTQWAFIDIASAVGGLEINSELVSASRLLQEIEEGTDEQGTGFLELVFDSMMSSLSGERLKTRSYQLMATLISLFDSKDLMIYSEDGPVQELIHEIGWSGALPDLSGDRLAIVDSNVGWNKVDRNIVRRFDYVVDLSDITDLRAELTLNYANQSAVGGAQCEEQKITPRTYAEYLSGCYWNYVRVYVPIGTRLVDSDDLPFHSGSIAVRVGDFRAGSASVSQMFDVNGDYFSGLMALDPQASSEIQFRYTLPKQALVQNGENFRYSLNIATQAGTRGRAGSVGIRLPAGIEVVNIEPDASISADGFWVIQLDGVQDEEIQILFRESS